MVFQQAFVTICLGHDSLQNLKVYVKLSLMILKFGYNFLLDEGQSQVQTWKYLSRLLLSILKAFFQEKNLDSLQSRPKSSALS